MTITEGTIRKVIWEEGQKNSCKEKVQEIIHGLYTVKKTISITWYKKQYMAFYFGHS